MQKNVQLIFLVFIIISMSLETRAQNNALLDIEKTKTILQNEREAIFIHALHLSVSQASVFHLMYVDYNKEKRLQDDRIIKIFLRYSENYSQLNLPLMKEFIKQSEKHQQKEHQIRKKYYKKMRKSISTEVASQFYEVDDFLSTVLRINILQGLPFTGALFEKENN
jgi:hypothetical protein